MGITVQFCPDLALRPNGSETREPKECLPEILEEGKIYEFLKKGQRNYLLNDDAEWSFGELPLCSTEGSEKLSRPLASIKILEVTHFLKDGEIWTKGKYRIIKVFDIKDPKINFEGCRKLK